MGPHGCGVQSPRGPHAPEPARRAVQRGRADARRARGGASDDAVRRDEAPEGARAGRPRHHQASRAREAAFPEPRPDPAHPRQVGEQIRRALGRDAQWPQARTRGGMMDKYVVIEGAGAMSVFEIYIKTTPERLWEAITDPQLRAKYSFGVETSSDWTPGSSYRSSVPGAGVEIGEGENLEVDPPHRLVQSFNALWSEDVKREGTSRVTWEIEQVEDSCRLTVTHDQLRQDAHGELYGGWPMILSGLKTLLETGELLTTPGSLRYRS